MSSPYSLEDVLLPWDPLRSWFCRMPEMEVASPPVFKSRGRKGNLRAKREPSPPSASSSEREDGRAIKRTKLSGAVKASSTSDTNKRPKSPDDFSAGIHSGDRTATVSDSNDVPERQDQTISKPSDPSPDHASLLGNSRKSKTSESDGSVYKGLDAYTSHIQRNPDRPSKAAAPVKAAPSNVRTYTVTDFAPDVCKDYKQTGYCGFGDSCKFLHARESYAQGWQLDKEWEIVQKGKKSGAASGTVLSSRAARGEELGEEAKEEEKLKNTPWKCIICKGDYKNPMKTTDCGHYFCGDCLIKRYREKGGSKCANCGKDTGGRFSSAKELEKLLKRKEEREAAKKEEEENENENENEE